MTYPCSETRQTLSSIWSSKRERTIAVRISYQKDESGDCEIYTIGRVEELD